MRNALADISSLTPAATSPAWVPALSQVNEVLTFISLVLALVLALGRGIFWLRRFWK